MSAEQKRVVVTGGAGFLGSAVVERLRARGYQNIIVPRSSNYDLRDQGAIVHLYKDAKPQVVIHLAGRLDFGARPSIDCHPQLYCCIASARFFLEGTCEAPTMQRHAEVIHRPALSNPLLLSR